MSILEPNSLVRKDTAREAGTSRRSFLQRAAIGVPNVLIRIEIVIASNADGSVSDLNTGSSPSKRFLALHRLSLLAVFSA